MALEFKPAQRRSVPLLISIASVSGGGKTYSALLVAAGIAGPHGKVGFVDTENGRGAMYVDSPGIKAALPQGYQILDLTPPFPPTKYIEAIELAEKSGINVLVVDSSSHEWEGIGGCCDIAENNKLRGMPNWALAKKEHKKFLNRALLSSMHIIFCLRAREKTKILKIDGKETFVPQGIQPICEKSFVFEQLLSFQLEEFTHHAIPVKVPEPFQRLFPIKVGNDGLPMGTRLLTKEDGERIREWNETGSLLDPNEQLQKRARGAAETGTSEYEAFFSKLTAQQKKYLVSTTHNENKTIAHQADEVEKQTQEDTQEPQQTGQESK